MQHTLDELPGSKNKSKPRGLKVKPLKNDGLLSSALTASAHEVPFRRRTTQECSTEVVATIARGYKKGITRSAWKAQLQGAQHVLTIEQGTWFTVPTMAFGGREAPHLTSSYNDPLVVEMKVASAIIQRILIDTGSLVDVITWDCLKKLTYLGRDIIPLVHPILGFGAQEVNPTRVIHLPLCFEDEVKEKNSEVDFLAVDVPRAYNIILGRPTLHKVKARKGDSDIRKQKIKTRVGYTSSSPSLSPPPSSTAPWPSSSEVPASPSEGVVPSSLRSSPSTKGERNIKGSEHGIRKKRREEEGTLHTSTIATSSLVTLNGSEELEGARSQELVKSWTTHIWRLDQPLGSLSGVPEHQLRLFLWPEKRHAEALGY
ncbi:hypothetical protein Cgig2_020755 [Carnegiea gigantea]|uniref:Uncharacterized protein n=1 Tax=Carnegiea gigantea TaxID=171969 RepID=A0A9Q1GJH4_9CARY|nr:hypothetical protein Cgig2_020755 [Carnegiea gigantea]